MEPITFGRLIMAAAFILVAATFLHGSPRLKLYWDRLLSWWVLGYRLCNRDHRSMSETETNLMANWAAAHGILLGAVLIAVLLALE